jgi:SAM-dependent methyltransferase
VAIERRLVFGDVADMYDRHRPTYPVELVDDLLDLAGAGPGDRVLEVGAGTGKATELFAAHGLAVTAVEPSPGMAAVLRGKFADEARVTIVQSDFERWDPAGATFPLLYSAQAWHWIDPERRYSLARRALRRGGLLAAFWNRPAWGDSPLRDALLEVYRQVAPGLSTEGSMHPANPAPERRDEWLAEIAAVPQFTDAVIRIYRWTQDYTGADYAGMLGTLSEYRLLDVAARERILGAVRDAIDAHGPILHMPMATLVNSARAGGADQP